MYAGRAMESGAGAHALQDLADFRTLPVCAKRLGVRRASAALVLKQASWPNQKNFVSRPTNHPLFFAVDTVRWPSLFLRSH